jgi:hypothetical protein
LSQRPTGPIEELAGVNGKLIGWLNETTTKASVVKSLSEDLLRNERFAP